jgi:2-hydroxychromene-2-carboxylate isomerase
MNHPIFGRKHMSKAIEFYFDFGSPATYLAWTQLPTIAAEHGAALIYRPVLLGGIHKATNNASPAAVPAKGAWMRVDLARFARRYGVRYTHNPDFPINTLMLMRIASGAQMQDEQLFTRYVDTVFRAMWEAPRNMGELATVRSVLEGAGLDASRLLQFAEDPAVKDRLKQDTEAAVARGLFGAPTMFVGEDMFFGQDRLDFVKEALR